MAEGRDDRLPGARHPGSVGEVFRAFLVLGLTSFGGPVAHLGYFREAFVVRRRWLTDRAYADLVALCQFLPGPASSQVGMAIGLQRAGAGGLLAAWAAFTLPSAIVLVACAYGLAAIDGLDGTGWIAGLKAAAVAVVALAVLGMARTLAPDAPRATIAGAGAIVALTVPGALGQVGAIGAAAVAGLVLLRGTTPAPSVDESFAVRMPRAVAVACLVAFGVLLAGLPVAAAVLADPTVSAFDLYYRAGALVFGGGHVVLPLLEAETVQAGTIGADAFLAGYGLAQAVPGPLFTFAGFLGAASTSAPSGLGGAAIALVAIFLPGALLVVGVLPFWERLRGSAVARGALAGANAGVVGILAAALYSPVFTEGITSIGAMCVAIAAFVALSAWKAPAWAVVLGAAVLGAWLLPG
ncbi:chromate efflux transporter [Microbacterium sp. No. 7]|uniref:chromate efflux transporter n=1 Tax=Microbacterium sp. No. 7 TaxID=1714373 RepID=UPI0006D09775|nr:chromate efflux transporter [Microbacterium sp. No. 7]ALJ20760.1 chromate transporter [Microbacterium sp. No. 7]